MDKSLLLVLLNLHHLRQNTEEVGRITLAGAAEIALLATNIRNSFCRFGVKDTTVVYYHQSRRAGSRSTLQQVFVKLSYRVKC